MSIEELSEEEVALVDQVADLIAEKVTERLHKSVLQIPAWVAESLQVSAGESCAMSVGHDFRMGVRVLTGGSLKLELIARNGDTIWRGVLSP